MNRQKREDLKRLSKLAFRRMAACKPIIEKFYAAPRTVRRNPDLLKAYRWMFAPLSFWPFDVSGAVNHWIDQLSAGMPISEESIFLVSLLGAQPISSACETVAQFEHQVKDGDYDSLIAAKHKFDTKVQQLGEDPEFRADWASIKRLFNVSKYQSPTGVIRRRMVYERNFHPPEWDFKWKSKKDRFKLIFDGFCHKWILYGMQHDEPLLQKLTVSVTAWGTMIFVPRYWSLDRNRDIEWPAIRHLHNARPVPRQGEKLSTNQTERRHEAKLARKYWQDVTQTGLKGDARIRKVIEQLKWVPQTDEKRLRRLLKLVASWVHPVSVYLLS
jgi:hypothetical protein